MFTSPAINFPQLPFLSSQPQAVRSSTSAHLYVPRTCTLFGNQGFLHALCAALLTYEISSLLLQRCITIVHHILVKEFFSHINLVVFLLLLSLFLFFFSFFSLSQYFLFHSQKGTLQIEICMYVFFITNLMHTFSFCLLFSSSSYFFSISIPSSFSSFFCRLLLRCLHFPSCSPSQSSCLSIWFCLFVCLCFFFNFLVLLLLLLLRSFCLQN